MRLAYEGNRIKFFVHQPHMVEDKNKKFGLGWLWGSGIQVTNKGLNNPFDLGVMSI